MKKFVLLAALLASMLSNAQSYSKYVNPFIGTGGHGHTFPGATVPFGMVQLSPDTRIDGSWDGCSGYHYSDNVIYGFSHTHLNGTGVSDFGDIMLMPTMGKVSLHETDYSSTFSHKNEKASAGFYSVKLDDHNIDVALTASTRVGFHKYKFNNAGQANVILDMNHRDLLLMGEVRIIDDRTVEVMRNSSAWARDQYVFARIEFSRPMKVSAVNNNAFAPAKVTDTHFAGSLLALAFSTDVSAGDELMVKVALSPTSHSGAKLNLTEIPHWDFNLVKNQAGQLWDQELRKIEVHGNSNDLVVFYTALYHAMIQPNIAQDIDGKYRGRDNKIHTAEGFDYYSVFSLWDTFRAAHPLYTLIDKKRTSDFINTFLKQYEQGGRLPVWELASNETDCMIGYHAVSVIADAMMKGIKGFDYEKAFEAAKHSAMLDHLGLESYKRNGFISIDDEHESVSKTLEYAFDDWCIAQLASNLGKEDDYRNFMRRSQNWRNLFDGNLKFIRPKKNGDWDEPFDPREVNNNFTEGNGWQYTFFVPQDIPGMIEAYGGNSPFEQKLDAMFNASSVTTGREQVDITGLIGQYAHGNEPSHHVAWLYSHVGKSQKTQDKVNFILTNFYKNSPDGLIGNEDCGQMSAWYVLASIGIYAVTPGLPQWTVIKPYFKKIRIYFEDGSSRIITKKKPADATMGFKPMRLKQLAYQKITPVPVISAESKSFRGKLEISIVPDHADDEIYFSVLSGKTDLKLPGFDNYTKPFKINASSSIVAYAIRKGVESAYVQAEFVEIPNDYSVDLRSEYNSQYSAGGANALVDGIYGTTNWRKGDWQGYQGQDFECVIDLKQVKEIRSASANFLQDVRSWIIMPTEVEISTSIDGRNFNLYGTGSHPIEPQYNDVVIAPIEVVGQATARFIKVRAKSFGTLPNWHPGAGSEAFIFIDEINVK